MLKRSVRLYFEIEYLQIVGYNINLENLKQKVTSLNKMLNEISTR